ncbi:hypothetical protein MHU86_10067 [Fragilaria crotonensis]|nr:hypothetical protein MHU86_10067 [Fragilaria crotonensis]
MSNCEHTLNTLRYADRVKERNAKTGALSASASNNRMASSNRMSRQSSFRDVDTNVFPEEETGQCFDDDSDENDNFEDCQTGSFEEPVADINDDTKFEETFASPSRMEYNVSSDSVVLDQLLGNNGVTPDVEPKEVMPSSSGRRHADQGETANALIATHRIVMASMLAMCKDEMAIANRADADRDTIDSYLDELEGLHERQCEMLTTLHEKLLEFRGTRGSRIIDLRTCCRMTIVLKI